MPQRLLVFQLPLLHYWNNCIKLLCNQQLLKLRMMNYENLREYAIEKGANPEDVDDAIETARANNATREETINQIRIQTGVDIDD
ncbi:hypothetical protein ML462_07360 [Gramella lutea]|uniref:Uncharacterized protein n=1 Tax=Christiangramia lutea TaxID=1607951 RepID=A0A9X1V566_9FLAO|nr:hypothetical protein [Christiangramia lutea]MCH4822989.1 hypothetical protein [Christiangramia lutea]